MIQWIWESSVDDAAKREIQPTLDRLTQRVADREYSEAVEKLVSELLGMPDLGDQGRRRGRDGRSDIQKARGEMLKFLRRLVADNATPPRPRARHNPAAD